MFIVVDKGDLVQFSCDEVLDLMGWNLLNFLMDVRIGLGCFREFCILNYNLMMDLIEYCVSYFIDDIFVLLDV